MKEAVIIKPLSVIHQNCDTQTEQLPFLLHAVLHALEMSLDFRTHTFFIA